jgi:5-methylthioribose kinase
MSQAPASAYSLVAEAYVAPPGFDDALAQQLRGIEVIRRLIGLAQLPLDLNLEERCEWLAKARAMILA